MASARKKPAGVLHRTRWDIMASVLDAAKLGRSKTYIMRKCNLSYRQLRAYLGILCERDLLRAESHTGRSNPRKIFVTTNKGCSFLKAYEDLKAVMERDALKSRLKPLEPRARA